MKHGIEGKLVAHDRYRFELKLGYTLDPSKKHNSYNVELYFFMPNSLGINYRTYTKQQFFNDMQGYLRFRTPRFTLDELIDPANPKSPLAKIKELLKSSNPKRKVLVAELKLYACTFRVALRNAITAVRRKLRKKDLENLQAFIQFICDDVAKCTAALRGISNVLNSEAMHEDIRKAYRLTDEYMGITLDDLMNSINNTIAGSYLDEQIKKEISNMISPVILKEFIYREQNSYAIYKNNDENELFLYRRSILKKLVTNILFLETHTTEGITPLREFIFAVSAGLAMLAYVIVSLWAGQRWSATSIPFALVLVVGYIVKDRIKDWFKLIFSKKMTRYFSDFKTDIRDPETDDKIGVCRHAFSFIPEKKVPREIMNLRRDWRHHSKDFWVTEDVMKYEKEVTLRPGPIIRAHSRLGDIIDIIRFNIHRFLERLDEPYEIHRAFDPVTGAITKFNCARTYHINLILRLANKMKRIRLVMDQTGLKRIEEVKDN